jgi:hypothetical protein
LTVEDVREHCRWKNSTKFSRQKSQRS